MPAADAVRRQSLEEAPEMLPTKPPPWIARAIAWLLIGMAVVALIASVVVHVPETVFCHFVLVPKDGADPVQSPQRAVIQEIRAAEGMEVKKGTELFVLQSDEITANRTQLDTLNEDLRARSENAERLETSFRAELEIKQSEIAQMEREVKYHQTDEETQRDLLARLKKANEASNALSAVELIRQQSKLAESQKELAVAQRMYDQVVLSRKRLITDRERQRVEERADIEKMNLRVAALKTLLKDVQGNLLSIRAPYDAVVISLAQKNAGAVIQVGQELCQLARLDAAPRAKLSLKEQGLPRLKIGQRARLFFDAFPYQRYGTVPGSLEYVSPAAVTMPDGPHFVALVSMNREAIKVDGEARPLRVGMEGEARIVVGSRLLIEYAFEPLQKLREHMKP